MALPVRAGVVESDLQPGVALLWMATSIDALASLRNVLQSDNEHVCVRAAVDQRLECSICAEVLDMNSQCEISRKTAVSLRLTLGL